ncbi:MAG: quinone-interacting membrane-bound oxidoreductase complex subunit QmoC [bacterium]|nr:quinone-interacting membrane-bound oxidoreductase complex subunit QmoC [bacterium]
MKDKIIKPDLGFIKEIIAGGGESLKKCYQCATCSVRCSLSPDNEPFPRKEMIKAQWGMKKELLASPDIWLCHQCGDCTTYCPRGAKPGEVLSAIRRLAISHYGFPGFLSRWIGKPKFLPFLLFIPALFLGLAILVKKPLFDKLGIESSVSQKIIFASTTIFPHWLLNSFFAFFSCLAFLSIIIGTIRFWSAMKAQDKGTSPAKSLVKSLILALKRIITHEDFSQCTTNKWRFLAHSLVFFGFIGLSFVSIWVITSSFNPLFQKGLVYPFNLLNPLKIMANLGGVAIVVGCLLMIWNRLKQKNIGTYFDWFFILVLLAVGLSGFATEIFHYARVDTLKVIVYFIHLVFVFILLMYLPYSKFAHLFYRAIALIYAEYSGRSNETK